MTDGRRRPRPYVELHCHSNFSFLHGASHPFELARRAAELEMPALALTDSGGVYGAVRFVEACRPLGVRPLIGACLEVDGSELVLLARTRRGYSRLCRLLSLAHRGQPKGEARAGLETVAGQRGDLLYLSATDDERRLAALQEALGRENVFVELCNHRRPQDRWLLEGRAALARRRRAPVVATNQVRYHRRERRPLQDVLTAIRYRARLEEVRHRLAINAEHELKSQDALRPLFSGHRGALEQTSELAEACELKDLDFRDVRFPGYPVPEGETPFSYLYQLAQEGARRRYHPITPAVASRLGRELDVIEKTGLAEFFLINWDLMRFARERGVPGQGRGSAADSIVAYVLGITRVDPIAHNLLFERFLHEEMTSTPDIDIDFSTEHREQVIRYVYEKYGWERTGMVCNVVTFRPRLAIRQIGKALGFPPELVDRLAKGVDRWLAEDLAETVAGAGVSHEQVDSRAWKRFCRLVQEIQGFPRHLSIHVGGMLVTGPPLVDLVPIEPAAMPGRAVVQFDKADVEELGLIKMDLLGLRTLSVVAETLELAERSSGRRPDLDALPLDDPRVFELCAAADTIGVFQIESRAQMMTLPRTRPETFNDLVVEVAIIRPGPIQGNAVHPYIRRKRGREPVTYAHPLLEPILRDTLGVILYQEQILEIAIRVAGMTPGEADRFRRAMSKAPGTAERMTLLRGDFVAGCLRNRVPREVAEGLFKAVEGFAAFGFCRSHAAAFARTTYETAWLKLNFGAEYYCALLNNQPMGFYHPSVLVEDARRHGVAALPVDVNRSAERCLPEPAGDGPAFRVGLNYVRDLGGGGRRAIVEERERGGPYRSFEDFWERLLGAPLNPRAVRSLVMVGAFDALCAPAGGDGAARRRELLWAWQERWRGRGLGRRIDPQSELRLAAPPPPLPELSREERTRLQYRISDLSTGPHLVELYRERLARLGALTSAEAGTRPARSRIRVAGLVITRQAPATARGVRFFTLEDELGHVNVTIRPEVYRRFRRAAARPLLLIEGVVQRQDGVWSLLAAEIAPVEGAATETPRSHDYR